jgi:hypothetical protein
MLNKAGFAAFLVAVVSFSAHAAEEVQALHGQDAQQQVEMAPERGMALLLQLCSQYKTASQKPSSGGVGSQEVNLAVAQGCSKVKQVDPQEDRKGPVT